MKKEFKKFILFLLIFVFITTLSSHAWWDEGHKVIAKIAYDNLTPKAKKNIAQRLDCPPEFLEDVMVRQSVWADIIKKKGRKETGPWHYINKPYFVGIEESEIKIDRPNLVNKTNELTGILQESCREKGADRDDALKFVIHFVGDIHCPFHNISLFTHHRFNKVSHDCGGTLFKVEPRRTLHFFWDGVPTELYEKDYRSRLNSFAGAVSEMYPPSSLEKELSEKDIDKWSDEAHQIARKAYFKNCRDKTEGYLEEGQTLSPQYQKEAEIIVKKQLALGGYRLANILNSIFDY